MKTYLILLSIVLGGTVAQAAEKNLTCFIDNVPTVAGFTSRDIVLGVVKTPKKLRLSSAEPNQTVSALRYAVVITGVPSGPNGSKQYYTLVDGEFTVKSLKNQQYEITDRKNNFNLGSATSFIAQCGPDLSNHPNPALTGHN